MSNAQESLGAYEVDVQSDPSSQVRQDPHTIDILGNAEQYTHQFDRRTLPDIDGFGWEACPEQEGSAEILEYWRLDGSLSDELEHENIPGTGAAIISGADDYLREHAVSEIEVPKYYTQFEDIETHYRWSADGQTHIIWRFLKKVVRLSNGYGNIDPVTTRVVLCDTGYIFVSGPRGAFLVAIPPSRPLRRRDDLSNPPESVLTEIHGILIPEENPQYQEGFKRYLSLLSDSPYPAPTGHGGFNEVTHIIETTADDALVGGNSLKIMQSHDQGFQETIGVYSRRCEGANCVVSVGPTHLPGDIGDEVEIGDDSISIGASDVTRGVVTGYKTEWQEKERVFSHSDVIELNFTVIVGLLTPDLTVTRRRLPVASFDTA